ncbi:MAG: serine acetyltransferase [Planctomycetota bacterium]
MTRARRREGGLLRRCGRLLLDSGTQALVLHRCAHALHRAHVPVLPALLRRLAILSTGADIHPAARLGRGVALIHSVGIVIGEGVLVDDYAEIYGGVVLGGRGGAREQDGFPHVKDDAVICVGAKVLGPITIGAHATVAAGAVVLDSVPDNSLAAGNPATIRKEYGRAATIQSEPQP